MTGLSAALGPIGIVDVAPRLAAVLAPALLPLCLLGALPGP